MITLVFCWIYTTTICLCWGNILLALLEKISRTARPKTGFSITCFAGLAIVGAIALGLSIFLPLDWKAHCLIVLPVLLFLLYPSNRKIFQLQVIDAFSGFSTMGYCLLYVCIFMVLAIASHKIIHPDTLAYHAQSIQWFEKYRAIPGIANIKQELGLQSAWFASAAILNPFGMASNLFFPGGAVLCWYLVFIVKKTGPLFIKKNNPGTLNHGAALKWLLLFIYTLISWTQLRLTAASASPDFIVSLYILCAVYSYIEKPEGDADHFYNLLCILFCCAAFITKPSALVVMVLPLIILIDVWRSGSYKLFSILAVFITLFIMPLLVRNIIASGYLLYPSSIPDWFNPDWKYSLENLQRFQHYITSYARNPFNTISGQEDTSLFSLQWVAAWWKHLALADQALLCSILITLIANLVFLKSFFREQTRRGRMVFMLSFAGCVLWFFKAPDPRFGTGFLLALMSASYWPLIQEHRFDKGIGTINKAVGWLVLLLVTSYTVYRLAVFFAPSEIIYPAGIDRVDYTGVNIKAIELNLVNDSTGCGLTPVPCITDRSKPVIPRGISVTDGFKTR